MKDLGTMSASILGADYAGDRRAEGAAALRLKNHLFGSAHNAGFAGFVGVGADEIIVYVHDSKRAWRDRHITEWEGFAVRWRYNVGPIVAQSGAILPDWCAEP